MAWYDIFMDIYGDNFNAAAGWFWLEVETPEGVRLLGEMTHKLGEPPSQPPYSLSDELGFELRDELKKANSWEDLAAALDKKLYWDFEKTFGSYDCVRNQEDGTYVLDFSKLKRLYFFGIYFDECGSECYNFQTKKFNDKTDLADDPMEKCHDNNFQFIIDYALAP